MDLFVANNTSKEQHQLQQKKQRKKLMHDCMGGVRHVKEE